MRTYTTLDLIRFRNFSNENPDVKPILLIKQYNIKYPELTEKEKLINIAAALDMNGLHKQLTGMDIPRCETCKEVEAICMCDEIKLKECKECEYVKLNDILIECRNCGSVIEVIGL